LRLWQGSFSVRQELLDGVSAEGHTDPPNAGS
jgi:hypothetical protein